MWTGRHKEVWTTLFLALAAISVAASGAYQRRPRSLLRHAHRVIRWRAGQDSYWLTSNTLLFIVTDHVGPAGDPTLWRGHADLLTLTTGGRSHLRGLTRLLNNLHGEPWGFELSPEGTWLTWLSKETPDGMSDRKAARLNGSRYRDFEEDRESLDYWLDDHHWVEQTRYPRYDGRPNAVRVLDVGNARADRDFAATSHHAKAMIAQHHRMEPFFYEVNTGAGHRTGKVIKIIVYRSSDFDRGNYEATLLRAYSVSLPVGATLLDTSISSHDRFIIYHIFLPNSSTDRIHRHPVESLWVSRIHGEQMHEVGQVSSKPDGMDSPQISNLQWLPDDKHLSFVYHNALWTMPTE